MTETEYKDKVFEEDIKNRHYAKRKHVWINILVTFLIVSGVTIIFTGVFHPSVPMGETIACGLSLVGTGGGILGFENHWITKYLFKKNKEQK